MSIVNRILVAFMQRVRDIREDRGSVTPEAVVLTAIFVSIAIAVGAILMNLVVGAAERIPMGG